jgi:hypothetical protein
METAVSSETAVFICSADKPGFWLGSGSALKDGWHIQLLYQLSSESRWLKTKSL